MNSVKGKVNNNANSQRSIWTLITFRDVKILLYDLSGRT